MSDESKRTKKFFLDTPLCIVWEEVRSHPSANGAEYLRVFRAWLRCRITLSGFYERVNKLIPMDLNERILDRVIHVLESKEDGKVGPSFMASQSLQINANRFPDPAKITAYFMLYECEFGMQKTQPGCAMIVFEHLKNQIATILEAVLRLARPFKVTEAGFPHSFGLARVKGQPTTPHQYRITIEDILDALNLENELVPYQFLLILLIKHCENMLANRQAVHTPLANRKMPSGPS